MIKKYNSIIQLKNGVQRGFERVEIFADQRWGNEKECFQDGVITSMSESGEAWVTWADKTREKIWKGAALFLKTEANLEGRKSYEKLDGEIKALQKRQEEIEESLERFKPITEE